MEKISWTDHVRNEDVLLTVKEQRNILNEIRKWKAYSVTQYKAFFTLKMPCGFSVHA
jgi:hypothetical protein